MGDGAKQTDRWRGSPDCKVGAWTILISGGAEHINGWR